MRPPEIEAAPGTPNWHAARRGCLTGSRMADAMAYLKRNGKSGSKGESAKARTDYMIEIVQERLTGIAVPHYVTKEMQWGLDHEDEAHEAYENTTGFLTRKCGFVRHPSIEWFGASPDGYHLIADGLTEYKCPTTANHIEWMRAGVVPEEHKPQMIAECVCTGRKWVDFVSYDPRMPEKQRLFVRRFTPTAEERQRVEDEARKFLAEVEEMFDKVLSTEMIG